MKTPVEIAKVADGAATVRYIPLERSSSSYNYDNNGYKYSYMMSVSDLEPATEYDYMLVTYSSQWNSYESKYDLLVSPAIDTNETAVQRSFVTAAATTEIPSVKIVSSESGFASVKAKLEMSGLNGQRLLEIGLTADGEDTYYKSGMPSRDYQEVSRTDNLPPDFTGALKYYEWMNETKNNAEFAFATGETSKTVRPYIIVRSHTEDGFVDTRYEGAPVTFTREDVS